MIKRLLRKLFYNPYRAVRANPYVKVGNSRLAKTFGFEFRTARSGLSFEVGDDCILMCEGIFESEGGRIRIGDRVFINGNTRLITRSAIEVEDDVTIAWGCTLYDHDSHSLDYRHRMEDQRTQLADWKNGNFLTGKNWETVSSAPIKIGRYAWIGFDVVILKGVTIGEGAIIGARSVVTRDVPPWTVAAGNPARVVKPVPESMRPAP